MSVDNRDENGWTRLHFGAAHGELQKVKRVLADGANATAKTTDFAECNNEHFASNSTPLHVAATFGHLDIVRCLVENGADIDADDADL